MKIDTTTHIADLVAAMPGAGTVFDAFGIDYSSPGERSIGEAAGLEGIDPDAVVLQLRKLTPATEVSWLDRPLSDLTDSLIEQHDRLIRHELTRLDEQLAELRGEPPAVNADLEHLREEMKGLSAELLPHLRREEEDLFPRIRRLEALWQSSVPPPAPADDLKELIKELLVKHGSIGARTRRLREVRLAIESADVSPRCRRVLWRLSNLEAELRQAMFLENCILFPRTLALHDSARLPITIGT